MADQYDIRDYLAAEFKGINDKLDGLDNAVNGNGQQGLVKTVAQHAAWLKILGGALAAVAGAVATAFIGR